MSTLMLHNLTKCRYIEIQIFTITHCGHSAGYKLNIVIFKPEQHVT